MKVRMIDCVGYIVESALGHIENDIPRMVSTPWADSPIPFDEAAEIGTKKVICDHSTIGILVTTDGSITDIPRDDYVPAEARVAKELSDMGKPFVILLNTKYPDQEETEDLRAYLENQYNAPVIAVNCLTLSEQGIKEIMTKILMTFPICEIGFSMPKWMETLPCDHLIRKCIFDSVFAVSEGMHTLSSLSPAAEALCECEYIQNVRTERIDLGTGTATLFLEPPEDLFYQVVKEASGFDIGSDEKLLSLLTELSAVKRKYEKVATALKEVEQKGYGIVTPTIDEMHLEEPEIVKQGSRFGVKLKAAAPSIHIMCNKPKFLKTA